VLKWRKQIQRLPREERAWQRRARGRKEREKGIVRGKAVKVM